MSVPWKWSCGFIVQCLSTEVSLPKAPVVDSVSKGVRILSHRGAAAAGIILLYFQGLASSIWKVKLKTLYIFRKSHAAIMCDALHSLQSSSSSCPASPGLYVFCCVWNKHFHLFAVCRMQCACKMLSTTLFQVYCEDCDFITVATHCSYLLPGVCSPLMFVLLSHWVAPFNDSLGLGRFTQ